jgi:hypothetical protein
MTVLNIRADRHLVARIEVNLDLSTIDRSDEDFPVITAFTGKVYDLDARIEGTTRIGALFDGDTRRAIRAGEIKTLGLHCGPENEMPFVVAEEEAGQPIYIERRGRRLPLDDTPIISLMTEQQRHFMTRAPRVLEGQ